MSGTATRQFARVTAALEDLHAVAVEGQRRDNPVDVQIVLAGQLRSGIADIDRSIARMAATLQRVQR